MDLAVVGNCTIASIIDQRARHVWFCYPRLDGDPLFNSLVNGDDPKTGFMDIEVAGYTSSKQTYLRNSAVLETILTGEGSVQFWLTLLAAYDVIFTTVCLLLFELVLNAE